jgi:hypothetical protein
MVQNASGELRVSEGLAVDSPSAAEVAPFGIPLEAVALLVIAVGKG